MIEENLTCPFSARFNEEQKAYLKSKSGKGKYMSPYLRDLVQKAMDEEKRIRGGETQIDVGLLARAKKELAGVKLGGSTPEASNNPENVITNELKEAF